MNSTKNTVTILLLCLAFFPAPAQQTAEDFLNALPAIPKQICEAGENEIKDFRQKISDVENAIIEVFEAAQKPVLEKRESQKIFFPVIPSDEDFEKMSEKELQQWAANFEKQQAEMTTSPNIRGVELDEKNYAQWEWWAANPESWDETNSSCMKQLGAEYNIILNRVNQSRQKIENLRRQYENFDDTGFHQKLTELEEERKSLGWDQADNQRRQQLDTEIQQLLILACKQVAPLKLAYFREWETSLRQLMPDFHRLSEIENEMGRYYVKSENSFCPRNKALLEVVNYAAHLHFVY